MRGFMAIAADRLYRLFVSERNTRISQSLIGMLLAVTVMGAVMYALFDAARVVRPVARVERFLGIEILRSGPPTTAVSRSSDTDKSAQR